MTSKDALRIPTHRGPGQRDGGPSFISQAGWQRLSDELRTLITVTRPAAVEAVTEAAAHGDRSENAEYTYGKRKLRELDRRMNFLNGRLKHVQVINPLTQPRDRVQFGATVVLEDEDGDEKTWTLVGEDEVDVPRRRISWKSPVGQALLGKRVGDEVTAMAPGGPRAFDILKIEYHAID